MSTLDVYISLLIVFFLSIANSAKADVLSSSNPEQKKAIETCLVNTKAKCDALQSLASVLIAEVEADIAAEAKAAGMTEEKYLSTDKSFEVLLAAADSKSFASMDNADTMISLIKLGLRYQLLHSVRFPSTALIHEDGTFQQLVEKHSSKVGIKELMGNQ